MSSIESSHADSVEKSFAVRWGSAFRSRDAAAWMIIAAASWWLLGELASVLRPLLLAVFLGYMLMPYYRRLRTQLPAPMAIGLLAGLTTVGLVGLALLIYASLLALRDELPSVQTQIINTAEALRDWLARLPYIGPALREGTPTTDRVAERLTSTVATSVNLAAGGLLEAAAAGLYLLFILLESYRFPDRVRAAYPAPRAEQILDIFGRINSAIISYLKAKVNASLILAVPAGVVLAMCGVRFALLWGVLTFLCNFIPYAGSIVAYSVPISFAAVQLGLGGPLATAAILLMLLHVASATYIEPTILGRAVGLSPLVILAALSLWGTLWGVPGMFLAVPLTMVLKITFENIESTRPAARLLNG